MRRFVSHSIFPAILLAALAATSPVKAQPMAIDQPMPARALATAGTLKDAVEKTPANCSPHHFAGDSVGAASARLFVAAQIQAGFSQADAVRALLVAMGIEAACTNALRNPQLFNGAPSDG